MEEVVSAREDVAVVVDTDEAMEDVAAEVGTAVEEVVAVEVVTFCLELTLPIPTDHFPLKNGTVWATMDDGLSFACEKRVPEKGEQELRQPMSNVKLERPRPDPRARIPNQYPHAVYRMAKRLVVVRMDAALAAVPLVVDDYLGRLSSLL